MAVDTNSDLPLKSNPRIVSIGHYSLDLLCDFKKVPKYPDITKKCEINYKIHYRKYYIEY